MRLVILISLWFKFLLMPKEIHLSFVFISKRYTCRNCRRSTRSNDGVLVSYSSFLSSVRTRCIGEVEKEKEDANIPQSLEAKSINQLNDIK